MAQWFANTMEQIMDFSNILNASIAASWMVLAIIVLRFLLKKVPRWMHVALWGLVAVRLLLPFSIESAFSLIPSADTIPQEILVYEGERLQDSAFLDIVSNPTFSENITVEVGETVDRVQINLVKMTPIWITGMAILLVYTAVSYWRLRRKVSEAVILRDNIYQSENAGSPFVLGVFKPRIYLPYNMGEQDLSHVVAHEQAHIRRRDHWWKPLGFLLLTIHWFNPLMWLAYVLLCRDIELACDEKVIKELGNEQRADYTQALVACSVNRRMIAACPLAFGEVGVKERVKSVMNYKKPAFWVIVLAVVACVVVAVCFLTNPAAEREFPINGSNVSELDTEQVIAKIVKAEKMEHGSQLCVNANNFDLMFTPDFDWANDGAIRFFYGRNQKFYSAQLRMFHDENKYFITERSEWVEQDRIFLLQHYLDALKYMPQEGIRQLSPDADGYSVMQADYGAPDDFDRMITYSAEGAMELDGWYIHLEVQPLHEVEGGAYNGSGDEVIHLFYGHQDLVMLENNSAEKWFDYLEAPDKMPWDRSHEINLPEFPDVTFRWSYGEMVAVKGSEITSLYTGMPIWNTYFCDLSGDGRPELCSSLSWGSGMIDNHVIIYDYANGVSYSLEDRGASDYTLRQDESDGQLYVDKRSHVGGGLLSTGRLVFEDDCLQVLWPEKPNDDIWEITDPTDDPNFAYDTAVEKIFEDANNEYFIGGLYSQHIIVHYTDGTQEDIVDALNAGRATFADLDKFGIRYWAEPKNGGNLDAAIDAAAGFYLTVGDEGITYIEISTANGGGGCQHADSTPFKKGEQVWLEPLSGVADLRGVEIRAMGQDGETVWSASIPDREENKGFTHLTQDGWTITDLPSSSG